MKRIINRNSIYELNDLIYYSIEYVSNLNWNKPDKMMIIFLKSPCAFSLL